MYIGWLEKTFTAKVMISLFVSTVIKMSQSLAVVIETIVRTAYIPSTSIMSQEIGKLNAKILWHQLQYS